MLYSAIAKTFEDVAMFVDTNKQQWDLKIINGSQDLVKAKLQIIQATTNTIDAPFYYEKKPITLYPDSAQTYGVLQLVSDKNRNVIYQLRLTAEDGSLIATCWHFNGMPKDLPLIDPGITVVRLNEKEIEITNDKFVYGLRVTDKNGIISKDLNGVHLLPKSKLVVPFTGDITELVFESLNTVK
jgi:hypothetical protein